jgi:hypothetical protein
MVGVARPPLRLPLSPPPLPRGTARPSPPPPPPPPEGVPRGAAVPVDGAPPRGRWPPSSLNEAARAAPGPRRGASARGKSSPGRSPQPTALPPPPVEPDEVVAAVEPLVEDVAVPTVPELVEVVSPPPVLPAPPPTPRPPDGSEGRLGPVSWFGRCAQAVPTPSANNAATARLKICRFITKLLSVGSATGLPSAELRFPPLFCILRPIRSRICPFRSAASSWHRDTETVQAGGPPGSRIAMIGSSEGRCSIPRLCSPSGIATRP